MSNETTMDDRLMSILMTSILVSICIIGLIGNAIVLIVGIYKRKYRNNVTNCYIMNLSVTDFLFLLISVPLTTYLGLKNAWIFGEFLCKMHIYLAHVLLHATCYTLAAMSIDRYLHIAHHSWYRKYRKPHNARRICFLIWMSNDAIIRNLRQIILICFLFLTIVSGIFMFPYEHFFDSKTEKHNKTISRVDCIVHDTQSLLSSCFFTFIFYYVLPLLIIGLCYLRVLIQVRRTGYCVVKRLSGVSRQSVQLKRRRVQRMLLGLTLAFALCWLPIHILELMGCSELLSNRFLTEHYVLLNTLRMIAHALSYFNSCLNPILYALLNNKFFSGHR